MRKHRTTGIRLLAGAWRLAPGCCVVLGLIAAGSVSVVHQADERHAEAMDRPFAQLSQDDYKAPIWSLTFSPDGNLLAAATTTGDVWLSDVATHESLCLARDQSDSDLRMSFSTNQRFLALAGFSLRKADKGRTNGSKGRTHDDVIGVMVSGIGRIRRHTQGVEPFAGRTVTCITPDGYWRRVDDRVPRAPSGIRVDSVGDAPATDRERRTSDEDEPVNRASSLAA